MHQTKLKNTLKYSRYALSGLLLTISLTLLQLPANFAQAQNTEAVSQQVYAKAPELPLENAYISKETGKAAQGNTLIARFIRYHVFVKSRSPLSRLDWKLTVADYLDANEFQDESLYPGYDTLKTNALKGDRAAIARLSRTQRDRLIAALLDSFGKGKATKTSPPTAPAPSIPNARPRLILPQPGDARLLKP